MTLSPTQRLASLGLELRPPRTPVGNFVLAKRHGDLLYLSGQGPTDASGMKMTGKVGETVTREQAYEHARLVTLNLLSAIQAHLGTIDQVDEIVKVLGFVNAASDFTDHPAVINGCSDLLVQIFGAERGSHARSAIGAGSLPSQISVEIEMIVSCRSKGDTATGPGAYAVGRSSP